MTQTSIQSLEMSQLQKNIEKLNDNFKKQQEELALIKKKLQINEEYDKLVLDLEKLKTKNDERERKQRKFERRTKPKLEPILCLIS